MSPTSHNTQQKKSPNNNTTIMISEENKKTIQSLMLAIGLLVMLIMAVLPIAGIHWTAMRYTYAFGAVLTLAARMVEKYDGKSLRIKRLYRIAKVSAALYCASAALLFYPQAGSTDWIAFLMAGAVLQIYATVAVERELKKTADKC